MKRVLNRAAPFAAAYLLALSAPAGVSANSGPSYWEHSPSLSMTPLENCPVEVGGETLTFDFSAGRKSVDQYSPAAAVTADYKMANPTSKPLTVQMAFPLIASLSDLSQMDGVEITAGGKDLPFRIAPGETVAEDNSQFAYYNSDGTLVKNTLPPFDAILQSVKDEKPVLKKFAGKGKLYRLSHSGGNANVSAFFRPPCGSLAVLATAVNGISQSGAGVTVEGYVQNTVPPYGTDASPPFSLLVFGAQSEPSIVATPDGSGQQASKSASPSGGTASASQTERSSLMTGEQDAETFLNELVKRSAVYQKYPTQDLLNRLTWILLKQAEDSAEAGNPVFSDSAVYDFYNQARVIVLAYEVTFPANGTVDVRVKYPMGGTMDSRSTADPVYTYGYLLNPAKGWASFRNLSISVVPSAKDPYVIKSTIPLTKGTGGNYTASLKTLPENDLVFSLYSKEKTEPKGPTRMQANMIAVFIFIVLLAFALGAAGIHRPGRSGRGPKT